MLSSLNSSSLHIFSCNYSICTDAVRCAFPLCFIVVTTPWKLVAEIQGWDLFVNEEDCFGEEEFTYNSKAVHPLSLLFSASSNVERVFTCKLVEPPLDHTTILPSPNSSGVSMCECTRGLTCITVPSSATLPIFHLSIGLWIPQETAEELPILNNSIYVSFSEIINASRHPCSMVITMHLSVGSQCVSRRSSHQGAIVFSVNEIF